MSVFQFKTTPIPPPCESVSKPYSFPSPSLGMSSFGLLSCSPRGAGGLASRDIVFCVTSIKIYLYSINSEITSNDLSYLY